MDFKLRPAKRADFSPKQFIIRLMADVSTEAL